MIILKALATLINKDGYILLHNRKKVFIMSKGTKINSFVDLKNRPVYTSILKLLREEKRPMSSKEMQKGLFPLQSFILDYSGDGRPKKVNKKYYKSMEDTTFNTYLEYLEKHGLIIRIHGNRINIKDDHKRNSSVLYRGLSEEEDIKLSMSAPLPSIDELLEKVSPENRDRFLRNMINGHPISGTSKRTPGGDDFSNAPYSTKQYITDKLTPIMEEINEFLKITDQEPATIKITYGKGKSIEL